MVICLVYISPKTLLLHLMVGSAIRQLELKICHQQMWVFIPMLVFRYFVLGNLLPDVLSIPTYKTKNDSCWKTRYVLIPLFILCMYVRLYYPSFKHGYDQLLTNNYVGLLNITNVRVELCWFGNIINVCVGYVYITICR